MRPWTLLVAILSACDAPTASPPPLPSLHGVVVVAGSDRVSPAVVDRMGEWVPSDADCVSDVYGGIQLATDVAPSPGDETVLASFTQGVIVLGADNHQIATTPGFECGGSRDELVAVEIVRTSFDVPVIAVAVTEGGRREASTWLELLAVGSSDQLDRLFIGEIERIDARGVHTGDVTIVPGGLLYRHPIDGLSSWSYDAAHHRYVISRPVEGPRSEERRAPIRSAPRSLEGNRDRS